MAKQDNELNATQSLAERLVDLEPRVSADPSVSRSQSVRQMKTSLRRDLEWLLNTRRNPEAAGPALPHLARSLYNYGLPDFSALSLNAPRDRNHLIAELQNAIEVFEPRLREVRISISQPPSQETRTVRFQIEAMLMMDPAPQQISFDTTLQLSTGDYQIRGDRGA
jgi:type VI secretion system protein ImpF